MSEGIANPDVPEIEITAEMIEAGIEELTHHYAFEEAVSYSEPEATARILSRAFLAMLSKATKRHIAG